MNLAPQDIIHDIDKGMLNGIAFDVDEGVDPEEVIPAIRCESCGMDIWVGIISSSCGDTEKSVWVQTPKGFDYHKCNVPADHVPAPECEICFPVEDDELVEDDEDDEPQSFLIFDEIASWTDVLSRGKLDQAHS